jgi:hypothetical protein
MKRLENRTPRRIMIMVPDAVSPTGRIEAIKLDPVSPTPRLSVSREDLGVVEWEDTAESCDDDGQILPVRYVGLPIPVVRATMEPPIDLPDRREGVILIVSALIAEACPDRDDLLYPGAAVRDAEGRVVGCDGLCAGPGYAGGVR